ncbi:MAG: heme-binding domain-containing protein [Cyclobacteriaceae bacterium]
MKIVKYAIIALVAILILIQLFPGEKPETSQENPGDIHNEVLIDPLVSDILKKACYDCHSNETKYPWYASVAPVSWLVIHDVEEGRGELNFSEWATFSAKRKNHKLEEIAEEVEEGEMPMKIYTFTHEEARLSEEETEKLINWALKLKE